MTGGALVGGIGVAQAASPCFYVDYRAFARYALGEPKPAHGLGAQERRIGETRLFVVPNPSPANAHFRPEDQVAWYDRLADFLATDTTST